MVCRGIKNVSGVGCHLSSAIVTLCYALSPLRNALLHILDCHERALAEGASQQQQQIIVEVDPSHVALLELARLLQELVHHHQTQPQPAMVDTEEAVDPSRVFSAFESQCNPYELGDATRALSMLLKNVRSLFVVVDRQADSDDSGRMADDARQQFQSLYEYLLGGSMQQELVGRKNNGKQAESDAVLVRRKRKRIPLTCPFSLDGSCDSVAAAIQAALEPIAVRGYSWDNNDYSEELVERCNDSGTESQSTLTDWSTTKQISFCSLPVFLLFHLRRFEYQNGRVEASEHSLDIPLQLRLDSHDEGNQDDNNMIIAHTYELVGGILHADEGDKEEEDYEGGHYVAICCDEDTPSSDDDGWCLVNDEKVTMLSQSEALDVLAGRPNALQAGPPMRGVMLVYSQEATHRNGMEFLEESFRDSLSLAAGNGKTILPTIKVAPEAQSQKPEDLVGKRLRIRWNKGKFYAGKVASYDETTGKHLVEYDDGDAREYRLHKKTIQWEDDNNS